MFKKQIAHGLDNRDYLQCMEKMRASHPTRAHLFEDVCKIASGIFPKVPTTSLNKFTDLWFNDPSVVESVYASMKSPNLCFLHPIYVNHNGIFVIHQHLGRSSYDASVLNPHIYKTTQIDTCSTTHMAIPLMFDEHANILLITVDDLYDLKVTVEHFEPHGSIYDPPKDKTPLTYNIENKAVELISLLFNVTRESIHYIPPATLCFSNWIGPQWHVRNSAPWWGTCTFWSMLYAFKRLLSPETPPVTTFNEIQTMAEKMEGNDDLVKATIEAFMKLVNIDETAYTVNGERLFLTDVRKNISNEARKRKGGDGKRGSGKRGSGNGKKGKTKKRHIINGGTNRQQLLIVFDIDETLIHYMPSKYYHLWNEKKHLFPKKSYVEITKKNGTKDVIIFRPHLQQLFDYLHANRETIKVAIWTYSERDYAASIADTLTRRYNLPANFFLFLKGGEDIDDENDYPKNLKIIFKEYPEFNVFNTILVDDRYTNINHNVNEKNGLLIEPFAPFGTEKARILLDNAVIQNMINNDHVMLDAKHIFEAVHKDIMGCDETDIDEGFYTEPVFSSRIKRMGLEQFLQSFAIKPQRVDRIVSIGTPYLSPEFLIVKSGLEPRIKTPSCKSSTQKTRKSI